MDIEGMEFQSIGEMLDSGTFGDVRQLTIEMHNNGNNLQIYIKALKMLRRLYATGLRIFMMHLNIYCHDLSLKKPVYEPRAGCTEISFMRTL
jgi:hypothetical protein